MSKVEKVVNEAVDDVEEYAQDVADATSEASAKKAVRVLTKTAALPVATILAGSGLMSAIWDDIFD